VDGSVCGLICVHVCVRRVVCQCVTAAWVHVVVLCVCACARVYAGVRACVYRCGTVCVRARARVCSVHVCACVRRTGRKDCDGDTVTMHQSRRERAGTQTRCESPNTVNQTTDQSPDLPEHQPLGVRQHPDQLSQNDLWLVLGWWSRLQD